MFSVSEVWKVVGASALGAAGRLALVGRVFADVRAAVLARGAARVLDGRDGVLEDELFLRAGFEQHRELVEAAYATRQLRAVHQVDCHRVLFAPHRVQERVLNVLGSRFSVHSQPRLETEPDSSSLRLHPTSSKFKVFVSKFTEKPSLRPAVLLEAEPRRHLFLTARVVAESHNPLDP